MEAVMMIRDKKFINTAVFLILLFVSANFALTSTDRPIGPSWDVLNQFIKTNYTAQLTGVSSLGRDVMICVMPDSFVQTFQPYAEWKHKSGTFIKIIKFSDIGATSKAASCSTSIKPYIETAYKTWKYRPSHVLLIGDAGIFPYKTFLPTTEGGMMTKAVATEEYFGEFDSSNGSEAEIMVGRLNAKNSSELSNMLQKIMNYEKNPVKTNTDWFKRIVALSSNQIDAINGGMVQTGLPSYQAETVRAVSLMQMALGFKVDTLMCTDTSGSGIGIGFGGYDQLPTTDTANVTLEKVIASINKGCAYINYRGTGWNNGWMMTPCFNFNVSDFPKVKNGGMMPFITGIGCGINMFDATSGGFGFGGNVTESFGELWMRGGTPAAPNGAIAVLAPPGETHSYWNNAMDSSLYIGLFKSGLWSTGHALVAAVDGMYKKPLNRDTTEYLARCYLLLGDPSTHPWQEAPQTATLTSPEKIDVGKSEQTFTVKIGAQAVKNAQVCVSDGLNDSITFVTGFTDANGSVKLSINAPKNGKITVYTWAKNIIPVENIITVGTGVSGIVLKSGNTDGSFSLQLNPIAASTISYSLPNAGNSTLAIYSLSGELIKTLSSGLHTAGQHSIYWNGRNNQGMTVARGAYLVSLRHENNIIQQRLTKTE
jgi:hypothetical protein